MNKVKKYFSNIRLITSIIIILGLMLLISYIFFSFIGIGVFSFFGINYISYKDILIYLSIAFIIGLFLEFLTDCITKVFADLKKMNKKQFNLLNFIIAVPTKTITFLLADLFIDTIEISFLASIVSSIILFFIEFKFNEFLDRANNKIDKKLSENNVEFLSNAIDDFEEEVSKFNDDKKDK